MLTADGDHQEVKKHDDHGVFEHDEGGEDDLHHLLQTLDPLDAAQGPEHSEDPEVGEVLEVEDPADQTRDHDHEVQFVPVVFYIGVFGEVEAHGEDLEGGLHGVKNQEKVVQHQVGEGHRGACGIVQSQDYSKSKKYEFMIITVMHKISNRFVLTIKLQA